MGPKTENFTRFYHTSEYKCLARAYSLHELYDILGIVESFMQGYVYFGEICPELWRFKVEGVRLPPNFQRPLVAKLYVGSENVFEIGAFKNALCHRAVLLGSGFARRRGPKNVEFFVYVCVCVCLSVTLLKGDIFPNDFAQTALELESWR